MNIERAIAEHRLLRFRYHGQERIVEPHTYGIDSQGHLALCAYQVGGSSASGAAMGWKTFHLAEMLAIAVLEERFAKPRPEYQRDDLAFAAIYAQL